MSTFRYYATLAGLLALSLGAAFMVSPGPEPRDFLDVWWGCVSAGLALSAVAVAAVNFD